MNIPLSPRLQACCSFIHPGDRVADVGTDHGYLGIWLLHHGIADWVIASDLREGPLSAAQANADKFGCAARMDFYLSDGVQSIPRDFDTLVMAGMGALTMTDILAAAPWLQDSRYRLVLQCQHKTHLLRGFLSRQGWHIRKERIVRDGRFLYTVMEAVWQPGHPLSEAQCWLPPALLDDPHPELPEYCRRTAAQLRKIATSRSDPALLATLAQLENDPHLHFLKEADHGNC